MKTLHQRKCAFLIHYCFSFMKFQINYVLEPRISTENNITRGKWTPSAPCNFLFICCFLFGEGIGQVSSSKELVENLYIVTVRFGASGLL